MLNRNILIYFSLKKSNIFIILFNFKTFFNNKYKNITILKKISKKYKQIKKYKNNKNTVIKILLYNIINYIIKNNYKTVFFIINDLNEYKSFIIKNIFLFKKLFNNIKTFIIKDYIKLTYNGCKLK